MATRQTGERTANLDERSITWKSGFKSTTYAQPNANHLAGRPPFDVYNAESEDIESYLQRLQEYFTAYDIKNDTDSPAKRGAILQTSFGSSGYRVLSDLSFLNAPNTKTLSSLQRWYVFITSPFARKSQRDTGLFCKPETGVKHRGVCESYNSRGKMWVHQCAVIWYSTRSFHLRASRAVDQAEIIIGQLHLSRSSGCCNRPRNSSEGYTTPWRKSSQCKFFVGRKSG